MTDRTVWIVNSRPGFDFSAAEKFGRLVRLYDQKFNPFDPKAALYQAERRFTNEGTAEDLLLLAGNAVANGLATLAFYRRFNRVNLLVFDAVERRYQEKEVAFAEREPA